MPHRIDHALLFITCKSPKTTTLTCTVIPLTSQGCSFQKQIHQAQPPQSPPLAFYYFGDLRIASIVTVLYKVHRLNLIDGGGLMNIGHVIHNTMIKTMRGEWLAETAARAWKSTLCIVRIRKKYGNKKCRPSPFIKNSWNLSIVNIACPGNDTCLLSKKRFHVMNPIKALLLAYFIVLNFIHFIQLLLKFSCSNCSNN